MKSNLLRLITDFQVSVNEGIALLKEYYQTDQPILIAYKNKIVPKSSHIHYKGLIGFNIHGGGCCLEFVDKEADVQFSYGPYMRQDGFHSSGLYRYARSQKGKYADLEDEKVILAKLQELHKQGLIMQDLNKYGYQFYLTEEPKDE
jgi:hypothetical protein